MPTHLFLDIIADVDTYIGAEGSKIASPKITRQDNEADVQLNLTCRKYGNHTTQHASQQVEATWLTFGSLCNAVGR